MKYPLETALALYFTSEEKDVWKEISADLLAFSFTDSETNTADSISLTLKDPAGKWAGRWKPDAGEKVKAYIKSLENGKLKERLYCGRFYVDNLRVAGAPRIAEINAVSIPLNKPIRKKIKNKSWKKTTLKEIAETIAKDAGVSLLYDVAEKIDYEIVDQKKESDLKFLSRLCEEAGASLKLTDEKIVIYDQLSYEDKAPIKTFELGKSNILSWSFETNQSETYRSVQVSYRNPKLKKKGAAGGFTLRKSSRLMKKKKTKNPAVLTYTYVDPDAGEDGQEFAYKTACKSINEAKRKARAKLRSLNRRAVTGDLNIIGDVKMCAGLVIKIKGFGAFDGNFIISEAAHIVGTSGYTTGLKLRRVSKNY